MLGLPLFVLAAFVNVVQGQTKADVTTLHSDLFTTYNKKIRPIEDQNDAVEVTVEYTLRSINNIDELEETMTTSGYLHISWMDSGLVWDPAAYNDVYYMYVPQNDVWKPDLMLANGNSATKELGGYYYYIVNFYNGFLYWYPYEVFTTECSIDMTYFPFDRQTCSIVFTIWSYKEEAVTISQQSYFDLEVDGNSIWHIESSNYSLLYDNSGTSISYKLFLKRKPMFFILNVLMPIVVLGCVTTVVFIIPADAGEKIGFSVTVFLSFAVFLTIVSDQLPTNSENTAIVSIYILTEVFLSVFALVISSVQLRLHHREEKHINVIYRCLIIFSRCLQCKVCRRKNSVSPDSVIPIEKNGQNDLDSLTDDDKYEWRDVSNALDVVSFAGFTCINIALTSVIFIVLVTY